MSKKTQLMLGAHTSAAGGVQNALYEGQAIGATTVQLFTSNQKRWDSKLVTDDLIRLWKQALDETHLTSIMSHDSYLINLGASKAEVLIKSRQAFRQELERCHALGVSYLNFHPGAAVGTTADACLSCIIESLLELEELVKKRPTRILLEGTAGQGSSVGWKFEQLATIIRGVEKTIPIGVCLDTCHLFAAGYDIRTPDAWEATLDAFDQKVGLKHLYAFHLNDSLKALGSRVDRHQPLGKGQIGWDAFRFLVTDSRTKHLPMYLETPGGPSNWKQEIAILKQIAEE
jgi:deoxyribonuclease IV